MADEFEVHVGMIDWGRVQVRAPATLEGTMGRKYPIATDGDWIRPVRRGYRLKCCDCGLVHKINFKLIPYGPGKKIVFQAYRDERATAACRRKGKK